MLYNVLSLILVDSVVLYGIIDKAVFLTVGLVDLIDL